ncbi:hypothetical protein GCM10010335_00810 [Streptomyces galbus]|nr:hypothetical protein GCM10010335_00810 [Streptomyces galbus]
MVLRGDLAAEEGPHSGLADINPGRARPLSPRAARYGRPGVSGGWAGRAWPVGRVLPVRSRTVSLLGRTGDVA